MTSARSHLSRWLASAANYGRTGAQRIEVLDGWRGIAILIVLVSHFGTLADALPIQRVLLGRLGVDFFFVLSGLLMANILFVNRTPLKIFYQRRFTRIVPVFVTYITVIYAGGWLLSRTEESSNFLYALFFLRSYLPGEQDIWESDLPIGHLWSLNVEEHAYVVLSLITLVAALKHREHIALFALAFMAIATRYLMVSYPEMAGTSYEIRTESAVGPLMLSAGYFLIRDRFSPYVKSWMPVAALVVGFAAYTEYAPWYANWTIGSFMFAFAVSHIQQSPAWLMAILSSSVLRLLGIWSYSIYLWQQPFSHIYKNTSLGFQGQSLVWLGLSILVGVLSFYALENPVRRYLNNRWEARRENRDHRGPLRRRLDFRHDS